MSYYNRYRNKRRQDSTNPNSNNSNNGSGNNPMNKNGGDLSSNGGLQVPDAIFDLGKNKRVTVRQFRNINLIDIREYYQDSATGELRPGKKGISLTEDLYDELLRHRLNIDEALRRFGSRRPKTKLVKLLSDDEYDDEDDKKDNADAGNDGDKKTNPDEAEKRKEKSKEDAKKPKRERDYSDSEGKEQKKRKPAAATLLPHEESIENAKREANATLVVPGMGKQVKKEYLAAKKQDPVPQLAVPEKKEPTANDVAIPVSIPDSTTSAAEATTKTATATQAAPAATGEESSDEEFAESLQAEMDKMMDESSEEE
ncbi:RNA polymerase II transcriptional coactivator Sub1p [Monosporozyma servazzii]